MNKMQGHVPRGFRSSRNRIGGVLGMAELQRKWATAQNLGHSRFCLAVC